MLARKDALETLRVNDLYRDRWPKYERFCEWAQEMLRRGLRCKPEEPEAASVWEPSRITATPDRRFQARLQGLRAEIASECRRAVPARERDAAWSALDRYLRGEDL